MPRIQPLSPEQAGDAQPTLEAVGKKLGLVPNMYATVAHSPAALDYALTGSAKMAKFSLSPQLREQLALTAAGANQCDYCASAHTAIGQSLGLTDDQTRDALHAQADDEHTQAVLTLAQQIVQNRGHVSDDQLQAARDAGVTDAQLVETVVVTAHNILTNYINHFADPDIDFPRVETGEAAHAA
ncbi:MAG: carboxymuconolactone decarboxylase family protein [Planctomycetota bacterium]